MKKPAILVVEDEPIVGLSLKHTLQSMGFSAAVVVSGEAALDQLEKELPDLILMDIRLKGELDGIQTAEKILQAHDMPIIYLTAYADNGMVRRINSSGGAGYLSKPFEDEELEKMIRSALRIRKARGK